MGGPGAGTALAAVGTAGVRRERAGTLARRGVRDVTLDDEVGGRLEHGGRRELRDFCGGIAAARGAAGAGTGAAGTDSSGSAGAVAAAAAAAARANLPFHVTALQRVGLRAAGSLVP